MRTFVFVCPNTGHPVPALLPEQAFEDPDTYHSIECTVCADVHLVNPTKATRKNKRIELRVKARASN